MFILSPCNCIDYVLYHHCIKYLYQAYQYLSLMNTVLLKLEMLHCSPAPHV